MALVRREYCRVFFSMPTVCRPPPDFLITHTLTSVPPPRFPVVETKDCSPVPDFFGIAHRCCGLAVPAIDRSAMIFAEENITDECAGHETISSEGVESELFRAIGMRVMNRRK